MTTAVQMAERDRDAHNARVFELQMEQFWKRWAPDDRDDAAQFQAELWSLVRQIYREAQEPLHKQMVAMLSLLPTMPTIPRS